MSAADRIRAAYGSRPAGAFVRIADIAGTAELSPAETTAGVRELLDSDSRVRVEPEALPHRLTASDREYAVHIGGEDRHLIAWC